ncbi:MAG: Acyl-CoA dehydrogenase, partial [uncultured Microvirga sp.]
AGVRRSGLRRDSRGCRKTLRRLPGPGSARPRPRGALPGRVRRSSQCRLWRPSV